MKYRLPKCIAILIILFWHHLITPVCFAAEEMTRQQLTVENITFDQSTRVFSGDTNPSTDIQIGNLVTKIVANEQGHFEFGPVPENFKIETVQFNDYIKDETYQLDFDFAQGKAVEKAPNEKPLELSSTSSSSPVKVTNQAKDTTTVAPVETDRKVPAFIWLLLISLIVLLAITLFLFIRKLKNDKGTHKKTRKRRKSRKKASHQTSKKNSDTHQSSHGNKQKSKKSKS